MQINSRCQERAVILRNRLVIQSTWMKHCQLLFILLSILISVYGLVFFYLSNSISVLSVLSVLYVPCAASGINSRHLSISFSLSLSSSLLLFSELFFCL